MLPEVIIHNSVSVDGSLTGFEPAMGLHHQVAAGYHREVLEHAYAWLVSEVVW